MRPVALTVLPALAPVALALMTFAAAAAGEGGGVAVETGAGDLTPWLALTALGMAGTLYAAHRLVTRAPRGRSGEDPR